MPAPRHRPLLIPALLALLALALTLVASQGASAHHFRNCGSFKFLVYDVKAANVSCATARRVARHIAHHYPDTTYRRFNCRFGKQYYDYTKVKCVRHRNGRKAIVKFNGGG